MGVARLAETHVEEEKGGIEGKTAAGVSEAIGSRRLWLSEAVEEGDHPPRSHTFSGLA